MSSPDSTQEVFHDTKTCKPNDGRLKALIIAPILGKVTKLQTALEKHATPRHDHGKTLAKNRPIWTTEDDEDVDESGQEDDSGEPQTGRIEKVKMKTILGGQKLQVKRANVDIGCVFM